MENRAEANELSVGDFVSWDSSGGKAHGKIDEIVRDGSINVPDSSVNVAGNEDNPAALIQIYRPLRDGWQETDTYVAHKFSTLTKIEPLMEPTEDDNSRELRLARLIARLDKETERKTMTNRDTRDFEANFEIREDGSGMTFTGYAAKFNSASEDLGGFVEYIERGAFSRSLKSRNDVKMLWNHNASQPLASTRSGTLKLFEDEIGLRVEAKLPDTTTGRDLAVLLRDGIIDKMSFGFNVIKDSWNSEGTERTLKSVRLFEISAVTFPAYSATEANVRGIELVAKRAAVDVDALSDVMLKIEEGIDITAEQAELMHSVISELAPKPVEETVAEEPTSELATPEPSLLEMKQKQLDLLLKRI